MAKAYWITCYREVSDPAKLAAYAKLAGPSIEAESTTISSSAGSSACRRLPRQRSSMTGRSRVGTTTLKGVRVKPAATVQSRGSRDAASARPRLRGTIRCPYSS